MTSTERLAGREAGITLVELLITMMIMSFIVTATVALVIGTQETSQQNSNRLDQIQEARSGSERMSETLRTAVMPSQLLANCAGCTEDAFVQGRRFEVQFYGNIDNPGNSVGPSRVTYVLEDDDADGVGNLVQTIQVPDSSTPSTSGYQYCSSTAQSCQQRIRTSTVARDVLVEPSKPLFRYFGPAGEEYNPGNGSLAANQLSRVIAVEIYVRVQGQGQGSSQARETSYIQRIMLPNTQAVIRQGEDEN